MPKQSAGLLIYRIREGSIEVFLAHPGGPLWAKKDDGAWSIPKGEYSPREEPYDAALREFREETGFVPPSGGYLPLEPVRQPGGKIVTAWAVAGDFDPSKIKSEKFLMEWPPKSGNHREFPEADRAGWFGLEAAKIKILKGQSGLLEQLIQLLKQENSPSP